MNTTVMIVEDKSIVAMDIESAATQMGYEVVAIAHDSQEALAEYEKSRADIILMDINLEEDMDGIDVAKTLLSRYGELKIVYLTAYGDEETVDRAIATKPKAYVLKPFKREELYAAMKMATLESRWQDEKSQELVNLLGGFVYKEDRGRVYFCDELIPLSKKELDLLKLLIDAKGDIVEFYTIDSTIWRDEFVDDNTRRTLIYRLRCKLNRECIETIPRVGCRIVLI